jgi:hypothetical protein
MRIMPERRILLRPLLAACCCLAHAGCFEEPVREHLHLSLLGPATIVVTVVQEVAEPELAQGNPALTRRMDEARFAIESGFDTWGQRFVLLHPLAEHRSVERVGGHLRRSVRSAAFASFDEPARLLEADGLSGGLVVAHGIAELQLFPTGGTRATAVQRQELERTLGTWSEALAGYFAAAIELYEHLGRRPDRAAPCFAHVFGTHAEAAGALAADEEPLVQRVTEAVERVAEALLIPDGEAYSLNELSRLVHDPFPARLTLAAQGRVLASEGLVEVGGALERPEIDAWHALRSLEGRWLAPDLVTALASPATADRQPEPDPVAFAALPRFIGSPPSPAEVESALLSELADVRVVSLRWRPPPADGDSPGTGGEAWLPILAAAESSVPD